MKVLFLSLCLYNSINERDIYTDLLREFIRHNHEVYIVSPAERRYNKQTGLIREDHCTILQVKTGNIQKTNIIEKGISTVLLESQLVFAIKKFFSDVTFDLVLYATPPITIAKSIEYIKCRDNARTYLMLKDIFPQNAVDMKMIEPYGVKSLLYKYFRSIEKQLYCLSDVIGCMSEANIDYLLEHNDYLNKEYVEICANSVEPKDMSVSQEVRIKLRQKYSIPIDKKVFIYGGNLGRPQGIDFLVKCLSTQMDNDSVFFLIVGDGTEYGKIETFVSEKKPSNVKLMKRLPKEDYEKMVGSCDVGLLFLDKNFTIPNFPSRILDYMQSKMPVFAITDCNTDIGRYIVNNDFGWWCQSDKVDSFSRVVDEIAEKNQSELARLGQNSWTSLLRDFDVKQAYRQISKWI